MIRTRSPIGPELGSHGGCRVVVGHPTSAGATAVEAVTGVDRPHAADAAIEPSPGRCRLGDVDGGRRRPGDAGPVEQRVDRRLVLEGHPLRTAMGDERAADQRGRLGEERPEHDGVAVRVERLDGLDDVGGGSATRAIAVRRRPSGRRRRGSPRRRSGHPAADRRRARQCRRRALRRPRARAASRPSTSTPPPARRRGSPSGPAPAARAGRATSPSPTVSRRPRFSVELFPLSGHKYV